MKSKVTVYLTSYNHEKYLKESIDSILLQSYQNFELYINDDASEDGSRQIIESYEDERITKICCDLNGAPPKFMDLFPDFKGEYVAIAHSDDKWAPDKLEKQVAFLDSHPDIAACFTQVQVIDDQGEEYKDKNHFYYHVFEQPNRSRAEWLRFFFDQGNCLCHPSLLIRKEAYEKYHMLTQGLSGIPDFIQWIRLCHHADIWVYPEKLTCFRVRANEENTSGDSAEKHYRNFVEQYLTLGEYVDLENEEEFLEIFPEGSQYIVNGKINLPFAYAQILMDQHENPMKRLYALNLIYQLLQDPVSKKEVEELYGYTNKEFLQQKQAKDIFSLIPPERFLSCTLYIDHGNGFTEEDSIRRSVYIDGAGRFRAIFQMQDPLAAVSSLRFDPDDALWREFWDVEAVINGTPVQISPVNSIQQKEKDQFFTLDCQYKLDIVDSEVHTVEIRGRAQKLSFWKIDQMLREQERRLTQYYDQIADLKCEVKEKEHIKAHEEELAQELDALTEMLRKQPFKSALRVLFKKI